MDSILISTGGVCTPGWKRSALYAIGPDASVSISLPRTILLVCTTHSNTASAAEKPAAALDPRLGHREDRESGRADIVSRTAWAPWELLANRSWYQLQDPPTPMEGS